MGNESYLDLSLMNEGSRRWIDGIEGEKFRGEGGRIELGCGGPVCQELAGMRLPTGTGVRRRSGVSCAWVERNLREGKVE